MATEPPATGAEARGATRANGIHAGFDARVSRDGRATFGPESLALRLDLDGNFAAWGAEAGARGMAYPPLLAVEDLLPLDYFANFPHLTSVVSGLRAEAVTPGSFDGAQLGHSTSGYLSDPAHVLPSAACYGAYLDLAGAILSAPALISTVATCFRREQRYTGLRRLFGFTMREIICVGSREDVLTFLATFKIRITDFLRELKLPFEVIPATDPFFDPNGARSIMQKLFPVKEEFVYDGGLAIASVNFHRNFFGERCDIRLANDSFAFTGCVAFGLERWLAALDEHFAGDMLRARTALDASGGWRTR
jgi:hypothetical protein